MQRQLVFFTVNLGLILTSITGSAIAVALPVLIKDYNISLVTAGWVLSSYQLAFVMILPLAGRITELFGQKRTFIAYTLFFLAGSMLCAVAPNIEMLIFFRILQAIGGGSMLPCAAGIVSDQFPEQRQKYIGLFTSIFPIGMIIGPNLGGWMIEAFGWRSIFWINVPLGVLVLILILLFLPRDKPQGNLKKSIDYVGAGLLFLSLFAMIFGLTQLASSGFGISSAVYIALFIAGIGLMFAFWRREHTVAQPIIEMDILIERRFLAANIYNILYGFSLGAISLVPLYAVSVYHMTILESGILLTPRSIGMIAASTITSFSLLRWGYRKPILTGTIIVGITFLLLALEPQGLNVFGLNMGFTPILYILLALLGIGHGTCTPASSNACIELMPDRVASISGLRGMFRQLGGVLGIALSSIVLHSMADITTAFTVVFIGMAVAMVASMPAIFIMPSSPTDTDGKVVRGNQ